VDLPRAVGEPNVPGASALTPEFLRTHSTSWLWSLGAARRRLPAAWHRTWCRARTAACVSIRTKTLLSGFVHPGAVAPSHVASMSNGSTWHRSGLRCGGATQLRYDRGAVTVQPLAARRLLQLHPRLVAVAERLFLDGHYQEAVFEAFKALEVRIQLQSGLTFSGMQLMTKAFADNGPITLTSSDGSVGHNEQDGFRFLYMGATVGIRNPRAHSTLPAMRAETALDYLTLSSLLMRRLDLAIHALAETDEAATATIIDRIEKAVPGSVPGRIEGWWGHLSRYDTRTIRVYALRDPDYMDGGYRVEIPPSTIDRDGVFRFDEVIPGDYVIFAYHGPIRSRRGRRAMNSEGSTMGLETDPNDLEVNLWWVHVEPGQTVCGVRHVCRDAPDEPDDSLDPPRVGVRP
jgi:uncharacterized protein (TIGR02391 family)